MEESGKKKLDMEDHSAPKLRAAILFFINKIPNALNRVTLCKHLYYADGHYFQKYAKTITEFDYLHIEGGPQPMFFNEIMHDMVMREEIEIVPQLATEKKGSEKIMVLKGMTYKSDEKPPLELFTKEEIKVLKSIAFLFKGNLTLETRYYPNLYQEYTQTGLYKRIPIEPLPEGTRPHLQWKGWANKIFRLLWQ